MSDGDEQPRPRWMRELARWALFSIVATGLMAPLASDTILPNTTDLIPHVAASWQARLALEEGQVPLRVAPLERNGRRYAQFQLYGQVPYTLAAVLQVAVLPDTPQAPYVALKIVIWASLVLAGGFLFRLARYLGARDAAALVAAIAYMAAPYQLVNLHARGAIPESIAQALLPLALYQLLRFVAAGGGVRYGMAVLAATSILLTHVITFAYSLAAAGLLVVLWRGRRPLLRIGRAAAVATGTLVVSAYFVLPILSLRGLLPIATGARVMMGRFRWVTPLSGLLSPASVPPVPVGSAELPAFIHPAIGLASLSGALLALALCLRLVPAPKTRAVRRFAPALLAVFVLGLLASWSPVDVWRLLPDVFSLAQFTYRLITLTMWSGALLLALALSAVLPRGHGTLAGAAGCTVVLVASGPYLTSAPAWREADAFAQIRRPANTETSRAPYSMALGAPLLALPDTLVELGPPGAAPFELPAAFGRVLEARPSRLYVSGTLPDGLAALDATLLADGQEIARIHVDAASVEQSVTLASLAPQADRVTTKLEWVVAPAVPELRSLRAVVAPADRPFARIHAPAEAGTGFAPVNVFQRRGDGFSLRVSAKADAVVVLPLELYPRLLDVELDDARAPYGALATRSGQVLASVRVPAGLHRVRGRFEGHRAGNAISLAGLVGLGVLVGSGLVSTYRRRRLRRR